MPQAFLVLVEALDEDYDLSLTDDEIFEQMRDEMLANYDDLDPWNMGVHRAAKSRVFLTAIPHQGTWEQLLARLQHCCDEGWLNVQFTIVGKARQLLDLERVK